MKNPLLSQKTSFPDSCALTTLLCLLAPMIFFYGKNWHVYSNQSLLICLALLLAGGLLWLALFYLARKLLVRWVSVLSPNTWRLLTDIIMLGVGALMLPFLLARTWSLQIFSLKFWLAALALALAFSLLRIFSLVRVLNTLLLIWLLLNSVIMSKDMLFEKEEDQFVSRPQITLKHKPNIYFFILESYQSLEVLEGVYGLELTDFKDFLRNHGFICYPGVYSHSRSTLSSMIDMFTLQDSRKFGRGLMDVNRAARRLLGGNARNFVFRTLKENGYFVQSVYPSRINYYMLEQGPYLDQVYPPMPVNIFTLSPLIDINPYVRERVWDRNRNWLTQNPTISLEASLKDILARREDRQPLFTVLKAGANHVPMEHNWDKAEEWIQSGTYQKLFQSSQAKLLPLLSQITERDPQAFIVLIGDHGVWRFKGLWDGITVTTQEEWDNLLARRGVDKKALADDFFATFLAIRTPPPPEQI